MAVDSPNTYDVVVVGGDGGVVVIAVDEWLVEMEKSLLVLEMMLV